MQFITGEQKLINRQKKRNIFQNKNREQKEKNPIEMQLVNKVK